MTKKSTVLLVVAVALIDDQGLMLMHRRRLDSMHGGLWEFPGGKIEPGESPESAALREIEEELGVMLDPRALLPVNFASGAGEGGSPLVILLYTCRRWIGEPECLEGEAIRWTEPGALAGLEMPPLDYPLARALISFTQAT